MKIVVCPDSFKGSLKASELADIISEHITTLLCSSNNPILHENTLKINHSSSKLSIEIEIIKAPMADGGEGSAEVMRKHKYPVANMVYAKNPIGELISTNFYADIEGEKAFIESAQIIGLPLIAPKDRNPLITSSYGLGQVINSAIEMGYKEITVSLGGSATCDAGKGMLEALVNTDLSEITFKIVCDVRNPLVGDTGAVRIFAPQKGASPEDLPILEKRIDEFVTFAKDKYGVKESDCYTPGAGAAGGLGFAFQSILGAKTFSGIDFIMNVTEFEKTIEGADIIISGEGKVDSQSLMGKVIDGVLQKAKSRKIPVIIMAGLVEDKSKIIEAGAAEVYEISDKTLTIEENMMPQKTKENLLIAVKEMLKSNIFKQIL